MSRFVVYLPYVSETPTGMQRYASEMILAFQRNRLEMDLVIGEIHGRPGWLDAIPYRVALPAALTSRVPRPLLAATRVAWLQFVFPFLIGPGRRRTLLALTHEVMPLPTLRQVAVVHDLTDLKDYAERDSAGVRLRTRLWRAGLDRSDAIIAISEATKTEAVEGFELDPDRISVIYEGVDHRRFRPSPEPASGDVPYLLYVGTLDPHKNIPFLLDVFGEVIRRVGPVTLKLAGRYTDGRVAELEAGVPEAVRQQVEWVGFVGDAELADLMAGCAAFVFPSLNEGFGLAVAEAMACGAPTVSSDAGSLAEVVGDGGVLLSPDAADAWVEAIERVLGDEEHRAELSERALRRAQVFSWDRAAMEYAAILDGGLLGKGSEPASRALGAALEDE